MEIPVFCGIAFLIIMSFIVTSNLIFGINTFLLNNKHKEISISRKKLKLLMPFLIIEKRKDPNSKVKIFKMVYVLSIIFYIIYLLFTISFILLCVLFNSISYLRKIIKIFFLVCFFLSCIFCCVIAAIHEIEKKKFKNKKKRNEMNFK